MYVGIFDKERSPYFEADMEYNHYFLKLTKHYYEDLLRTRGYLYLNQIVESLGLKWDPKDENVCIINGENELNFMWWEVTDLEENSEGFLVQINAA